MASVFYEQVARLHQATIIPISDDDPTECEDIRIINVMHAAGKVPDAYLRMTTKQTVGTLQAYREMYYDTLADLAIMAMVALHTNAHSSSRVEGFIRRRMDYHIRRIS